MTSRLWVPMEPVEPRSVIFFDIKSFLLWLLIEDRRDHHGDERCNEHHTVKAVQDAALAWENGAVILDAALALDHAGKQVAINAQHRRHTCLLYTSNLHVHTADPGKILSEAIKYGYLTNFKIENMHEQFLARQRQGKSLETVSYTHLAIILIFNLKFRK